MKWDFSMWMPNRDVLVGDTINGLVVFRVVFQKLYEKFLL